MSALRDRIQKALDGIEPMLLALIVFIVAAAFMFAVRGRGNVDDWYYRLFYFFFIAPMLFFGLTGVALSWLIGRTIDIVYVSLNIVVPLFLLAAGAWIFWSEHSWVNAVLVPFVFVCVLLNLCAVGVGLYYFFRLAWERIARRRAESHGP